MYSEVNSQMMQPSQDRSTDVGQLLLAASRKRNTSTGPSSYMSMMLDRHAPSTKRIKTEHKPEMNSGMKAPQMNQYLMQQTERMTAMQPSASSLTPMPASLDRDRTAHSLSMSTNAFLMDHIDRNAVAARQASSNQGLLQALSTGRSDPATNLSTMQNGLSNLMPSLANTAGDMGFASSLNNNGNSNSNNGLISGLDSATSSMAARQRLGLAAQGMTQSMMPNTASMMQDNANTHGSTLRRSSLISAPPRGDQTSLLLESLNPFQGVPSISSHSAHHQSGSLIPGISAADRAFLRGLLDGPSTSGFNGMAPSATPSVGGMGSSSFQNQFCSTIGTGVAPSPLPMILASPNEDNRKLSEQQVFLRHQIEVFEASQDDTTTHTRGRNKPIRLGQVGIRCKHCAHLPVVQRQKGSTYFPATLLGLYQAAQNMSTTHMQSGLCREMPQDVKEKFANFQNNKVTSSGAGRPYWANAAKRLGLVDTPEDGIRHFTNVCL